MKHKHYFLLSALILAALFTVACYGNNVLVKVVLGYGETSPNFQFSVNGKSYLVQVIESNKNWNKDDYIFLVTNFEQELYKKGDVLRVDITDLQSHTSLAVVDRNTNPPGFTYKDSVRFYQLDAARPVSAAK
jgi:hypothetical protein